MAEFVVAESGADFASWWKRQLADAPPPASEPNVRGESIFLARCAACHTVRGIGAGGIVGPDLTHLMSRRTLGAGTVPNDPESLRRWIANAQAVKPGCRMPALDLSHDDVAAVASYVQTLL